MSTASIVLNWKQKWENVFSNYLGLVTFFLIFPRNAAPPVLVIFFFLIISSKLNEVESIAVVALSTQNTFIR